MVTPSRVRMNKLRHKQGLIAKNNREDSERRKELVEKDKYEISKEEHENRLSRLKEIGLIK